VKDETTILLYALSTIAQTVAALAAFVEAVGIFRLQLLRSSNEQSEDTIKGIMAQRISRERSIHEIEVFERWVTPEDADGDLFRLASLN
jgi:hypothetical protein